MIYIKNKKAFTLIELAVVLFVISSLLVVSFEVGKFFLIQNQIKATNVKLNAIQKAIEIYVRRTNHLPCPTYLAEESGYGIEDCDTAVSDASKGFYQTNDAVAGGIPYRDLNLSADMSYDAWGGKFVYKVYKPALTDLRNIDSRNIDTNKYIVVYENVDSALLDISAIPSPDEVVSMQTIYTLSSFGQNKYGVYNFNSNEQIQYPIESLIERKNGVDYPDITIYYTDPHIADDIIRYKTITQMISDAELTEISCCVTESIIERLVDSLDINTEISFGSTDFDENCKFLSYNAEIDSVGGSEKYRLKCFKYGRLGILKVNN